MKKEDRKQRISVQETIPFTHIYKDGLCKINDHYFTSAMAFDDISYQMAEEGDGQKRSILFDEWCAIYNYFSREVHVQVFCSVRKADPDYLRRITEIPLTGDDCDVIRTDLMKIMRDALKQGTMGYVRTKIMVFGVEAQTAGNARIKLNRVQEDISTRFKVMGVKTHQLSGYEWLGQLHNILDPGDFSQFVYNDDLTTRSGITQHNFIAPMALDFSASRLTKGGRYCRIGEYYASVMYFDINGGKLCDDMLSKILSVNRNISVSIHCDPLEQSEALKYCKHKQTDIKSSTVSQEKRASDGGYSWGSISRENGVMDRDIEDTLMSLESSEDHLLMTTIMVMSMSRSRRKLDDTIEEICGIARNGGADLKRMLFRQESGAMSILPLGVNLDKELSVKLTTTGVAGFVPFTAVELLQTEGRPLYLGTNALTGNLVLADRGRLENPNGLIIGIPGGGKSVSVKMEVALVWLITEDDIVITDPESEYRPLVEGLHGTVITISPSSRSYINPLDISFDELSENYNDAVTDKMDYVHTMVDLMLSSNEKLTDEEKSLIDWAGMEAYEEFSKDPRPENMPVLSTLRDLISDLSSDEARHLAVKMYRFTDGSASLFNHRTNVDVQNRLICFDIRELGNQLRPVGMLAIQNFVWNRVFANRNANRTTRYMMDEFHIMLRNPQTAAYSLDMFKRFRKYNAIPTGITQNIGDIIHNRAVEAIFKDSQYIRILKLKKTEAEEIADLLDLSADEIRFCTEAEQGSGLLAYGDKIIPFRNRIPTDTHLYKLVTTKPGEQYDVISKSK